MTAATEDVQGDAWEASEQQLMTHLLAKQTVCLCTAQTDKMRVTGKVHLIERSTYFVREELNLYYLMTGRWTDGAFNFLCLFNECKLGIPTRNLG
jgi:hypothetical protein